MNNQEYLYTVSEMSQILKVNKNYVYELMKHGYLTGLKLGSMKVTRTELLRFLKENNGKDFTDLNNIKILNYNWKFTSLRRISNE